MPMLFERRGLVSKVDKIFENTAKCIGASACIISWEPLGAWLTSKELYRHLDLVFGLGNKGGLWRLF